jgi:predicted transcriptional regulator
MEMEPLKQQISQKSGSLFPLSSNFRVARLGEADARTCSDDLKALTNMIASSEDMYPKIGRWINEKVVPGLRSSERAAWVAYEGDRTIAAAVLKVGPNAKFCHLRVENDFQDMDLGQLFFTQMTLETRRLTKQIHFTLPESLWQSKMKFFESFGFRRVTKSIRQYRNGDTELVCSAPHAVTRVAALDRLPALVRKFNMSGYSLYGDLLVSMKPQYAERILGGTKLIEIRKRFSEKWVGCKAILYSSSPQQALVGEAVVRSVTSGCPTDIWTKFGTAIGCSSKHFDAYFGLAKEVSAIELDEVFPYRRPIGLSQISRLLREDLKPPQSYCDLSVDDGQGAWARAVSIASVLHGHIATTKRPRPSANRPLFQQQ